MGLRTYFLAYDRGSEPLRRFRLSSKNIAEFGTFEQFLGPDHFDIMPHLVAIGLGLSSGVPDRLEQGKIGKECGASDLPARRCCQLRVYPGSGIHDCRYSGGDGPHCRRSDNRHGVYRWGAILRLKDSVKGTATAASLWITGAIGATVGLGSLDVAIMLSVITVATLWIMAPLKHFGHLEQEDGSDEVRKEK